MGRRRWFVWLVLAASAAGCRGKAAPASHDEPVGAPRPTGAGPVRYLKGQLHAHTGRSGDSRTSPEGVARWYAAHGFDFLVFTDHNTVTLAVDGPMLTIPGAELTQSTWSCLPPPPEDVPCLLHVNALFVDTLGVQRFGLGRLDGQTRLTLYQRALDQVTAWHGIAQLNHPNMGWAVDADLVVELVRRGVVLMEIANQNEAESNAGDATHPSTEALWDQVLTAGARVYGVATDDAHHYDDAAEVRRAGSPAFVGNLGWVMVRAEKDARAIREALSRGDFYSSTGVELSRAEVVDGRLVVEVPGGAGPHEITFIGSGGRRLATITGARASFALGDAPPGYLRAVVHDGRGKHAWVQPVWIAPRAAAGPAR